MPNRTDAQYMHSHAKKNRFCYCIISSTDYDYATRSKCEPCFTFCPICYGADKHYVSGAVWPHFPVAECRVVGKYDNRRYRYGSAHRKRPNGSAVMATRQPWGVGGGLLKKAIPRLLVRTVIASCRYFVSSYPKNSSLGYLPRQLRFLEQAPPGRVRLISVRLNNTQSMSSIYEPGAWTTLLRDSCITNGQSIATTISRASLVIIFTGLQSRNLQQRQIIITNKLAKELLILQMDLVLVNPTYLSIS